MGELIKIQKEEVKPRVVCGHCKNEILIDIKPFSQDCTKIMQDKCPNCNGTLFVGLLILSHPKMNGLLQCIERVINALSNASQIIGGEKQ